MAPPLIDHLIFGAPDLEQGIEIIQEKLGVEPVQGGQHTRQGTHNALIGLGPGCYLEIIAPDSTLPAVAAPLWMGLSELTRPRLIWWAARVPELGAWKQYAERQGIELGDIRSGRRSLPDGQLLQWRMTDPHRYQLSGLQPFFLEWKHGIHPSDSLTHPCRLIELRGRHPRPKEISGQLQKLRLDIPIDPAAHAGLMCRIETPAGEVLLEG